MAEKSGRVSTGLDSPVPLCTRSSQSRCSLLFSLARPACFMTRLFSASALARKQALARCPRWCECSMSLQNLAAASHSALARLTPHSRRGFSSICAGKATPFGCQSWCFQRRVVPRASLHDIGGGCRVFACAEDQSGGVSSEVHLAPLVCSR